MNEWILKVNLEIPKSFDGFHSKNKRMPILIDESKHIDLNELS